MKRIWLGLIIFFIAFLLAQVPVHADDSPATNLPVAPGREEVLPPRLSPARRSRGAAQPNAYRSRHSPDLL
jgi:hypothetical protein